MSSEYAVAREFLEALGPGERVSMVPGNHDAYVRGTALLHLDIWKEYITGDADTKNIVAGSAFPYVRHRGPLAIVGLSTAIPTGPFLATGRLGTAQLHELARILPALKEQHRFRVILIHHPPAGVRSPHERLTDAAKFRALIAQHGAELILHGHDHRASIRHIAGPDTKVPVVGVPSASNPGVNPERGGAYNLYRIGGKAGAWECVAETCGFAPDGTGVTKVRDAKIW